MIRSFRCAETQRLFSDQASKKFHAIHRIARRKLEMIHAAQRLDDLRNPPGNRLELLKGDRAGQLAFGLMTGFGCAFVGLAAPPKTSRYLIIIREIGQMSRKLKPITPGEILLEEFLNPLGISQTRLARDLDVPVGRINDIVLGKRAITP